MQIKEAKIYNFGKLQNRTLEFKPGINLIYGENESGKTTLHMFLKSMLFGMEKQKGRASIKDPYQKYEPWHASSYYCGALRFEVEGKPFYLERNFYSKEKKDYLCNEADGEEMSVAYGDLEMLLGGISQETYENTYDIPQCGVVTGGQMSGLLAEYLSDAAGSGDASTKVIKALQGLAQKRKERQIELKKYKAEKEEKEKQLLLQRELIERELQEQKRLIHQTRHSRQNQSEEREKKEIRQQQEEERPLEGKQGKVMELLGAGLLLFNAVAYWMWYRKIGVFCALEVLFLLLFLYGISQKQSKREDGIQEAGWQEDETVPSEETKQLENLLQRLEENVQEKEARLTNLEEEILELRQVDIREKELVEDIKALDLATQEINRLAKEFCEDIRDELDAEVSKQISHITAGKYDRIRIDETGSLEVFQDGRKVSLEQLSQGTYEQFYLALRLAVGTVVTQEEPLPILLDEVFSMYDEKRLEQALRILEKTGHQIFLFTCQQREEEHLQQMGISYHKVCL